MGFIIRNGVLTDCLGLCREAVVPKNVTAIGDRAFYMHMELQSLKLPAGLRSIGRMAFGSCFALRRVTIPEGTVLEYGAFCECIGLERVNLPDAMTAIPDRAFCNCSHLQSISLPQALMSVGRMAFHCSGLKHIALPERIVFLGNGAFEYCLSLQEICIPASVKRLPMHVFQGCSNLQKVTIQGRKTSISKDAFEGCPENMTILADHLPLFKIPEGLRRRMIREFARKYSAGEPFPPELCDRYLSYIRGSRISLFLDSLQCPELFHLLLAEDMFEESEFPELLNLVRKRGTRSQEADLRNWHRRHMWEKSVRDTGW